MDNFIESVKKNPCLWHTNHILYRDTVRKDMIWDEIAKEFGLASGKDAKSQWKKLRDSHREAMRRRKLATGNADLRSRIWKYEREMEFLISLSENDAEEPNAHDYHEPTESTLPLSPESNTEVKEEREKRREEMQIQRDELRRQTIDSNRFNQDALGNLFTSLCQKTRELPKVLQLRVQREIFEVVTRAEEEALSYDMGTEYNISRPAASPYGYVVPQCTLSDDVEVKPHINQ